MREALLDSTAGVHALAAYQSNRPERLRDTVILADSHARVSYLNPAEEQNADKLQAPARLDEHAPLLERAELIKRLWQLLHEPDAGDAHALVYLNLDNFKAVNNRAGHAAGDLAMRQIASRFMGVMHGRDTLARLGGDEFGLLLERCSAEHARARTQQLHRAVESYALRWNNETYQLGASIGLALFKTHNLSLNTILSAANVACHRARQGAGEGVPIREIALD